MVSGSEGDQTAKEGTDYSVREFKKTFELPSYVDSSKLVSFMTANGTLVVEFPWKQEFVTNDLFPKVDEANKQVTLHVNIPEDIDPNRLHVSANAFLICFFLFRDYLLVCDLQIGYLSRP